mmetsp:Transcript_614/g.1669  ORF Transcript_614/g.1669 Transcript_614/m.1669 type:complete len:239 (+) Transcript_614:220-936(+)
MRPPVPGALASKSVRDEADAGLERCCCDHCCCCCCYFPCWHRHVCSATCCNLTSLGVRRRPLCVKAAETTAAAASRGSSACLGTRCGQAAAHAHRCVRNTACATRSWAGVTAQSTGQALTACSWWEYRSCSSDAETRCSETARTCRRAPPHRRLAATSATDAAPAATASAIASPVSTGWTARSQPAPTESRRCCRDLPTWCGKSGLMCTSTNSLRALRSGSTTSAWTAPRTTSSRSAC